MNTADRLHLEYAVSLAREAAAAGDFPIGAVLVDASGRVLGADRNHITTNGNRLEHAEMRLLHRLKFRSKHDQRGMTLYTSLEPCLMCFGTAVITPVSRIVWAANDPYGGAGGLVRQWMWPSLTIPSVTPEPFPDLRAASSRLLMDFLRGIDRLDMVAVWKAAGYGELQ